MANKESQLALKITAENAASAVFEEIAKGFESLTKSVQDAAGTVGGSWTTMTDSFSKGSADIGKYMGDGTTAVEGFTSKFGEQVSPIEAAAKSIASSIAEITTAAQTGEGDVSRAIAGDEKAFTGLESALSSQTAAIEKAIESMSANVTKSLDEMQKTIEQAAQAGDKSMNTLRDSMSKGIGEIGGVVAVQMLGQSLEHLGQQGQHLFDFAIEQGADFQQSMKNIQTVIASNTTGTQSWNDKLSQASGLTSDLQQKALDLGSRGAQSANEVAAAMDAMLRQGMDGKAILDGGVEAAQNVSIVTQAKLDESANLMVEIYHSMRQQFNENGKSMTQNLNDVGNVLAGTLMQSKANVNDFMNSIKYVGPLASELGTNFGDLATATALLNQNAIKG